MTSLSVPLKFVSNHVTLTSTPQIVDDSIVPAIIADAMKQNVKIFVNGSQYYPAVVIGNTVFNTVPGPPLLGTWPKGQEAVDIHGYQWQCQNAGTPGIWGALYRAGTGLTGNLYTYADHTDAPIYVVPVAGGPAVLGDNFRVFPGGDVFNPVIKLRSDGTIQAAKGDPAGGSGVEAWGAVTTVPTGNPDGSHTLDGSVTNAGGVGWVDANGRRFWRRTNGITRQLDGAHLPGSPNAEVVGDWLLPPTDTLGTYAIQAGDNNKMFLIPVDVTDITAVFNKVGALCSVAGVGGTFQQFRLGAYLDDGTGMRPNLTFQIADFGLTSGFTALTSTAPTATLSSTYSFAANGRVWLAAAYQESGSPTSRATINTANSPMMNAGTDLSAWSRGWYVTGVSGALPTSGTLVATTVVPFVGLRRSA